MALIKSVAEIITEDTSGLLGIHPTWSRVQLHEIATILNGFPFESDLFSTESGTPLIRIRNVLDGSTETYYRGEYEPQFIVQPGERLIGMDGDFHSARWKGSEALLNQRVCKVSVDDRNYHPRLLDHLLPGYLAAINAATSSITVKHLSSRTVAEIDLPLPPFAEQTRIVEKLEELLSDLDAGVVELKAAQRKLAQYRQSLLKAAVEGALTAGWRRARAQTCEPQESGADLLQRIFTERRTRWETKQLAKFAEQGKTPPNEWQGKYEEPASIDTALLRELPQTWVWARAEQLCGFITKGTTPPKGLDASSSKTIPFLRVTNLTSDGTLNLDDKVFVSEHVHRGFLARSIVYPGDVLMNIVGPPLGQVSVTPPSFDEWNINQAVAVFRAVNGMSPRFISFCLLSAPAQAWLAAKAKTTAGQTNLTLEVCRDLPIAVPPESEQHEIAQTIDAALAGLADQDAAVAIALRQSFAQRKNILKAAFAGELVPQDPNDEPASVLLDRIRAERDNPGNSSTRPRRSKAPTRLVEPDA